MKKFLIRIYKRLKVYLNKISRTSSMKSYDEVELHEKTVFKICLKLISDKDSEFMIAPMSRKRFIMNETLNLYILIDYGRVEITNHIFHYDVRLSSRNYERITYLYDMEAEKRRSNTEMTIKSNIKNTLEKVYDAISKETQKNK